jgi:hypothetical protein
MVTVGTATLPHTTTTDQSLLSKKSICSVYICPRRPRHYGLVARVLRRQEGWLCAMRTRCSFRVTPVHLCQKPLFSPMFPLSLLTSKVSTPRMLSMVYPNEDARLRTNEQPMENVTASTDYPIVIDTGASISVSPVLNDFVEGISDTNVCDLKGLNHSTEVRGMGMVEWTIYDVHNKVKTIQTLAFYAPDATIRLFSPQTYFSEGGEKGFLHCDKDRTALGMHDGFELVFPYNCETNLPFMLPATHMNHHHNCTHKQNKCTVGLTRSDIGLFSDPDALMGLMTVADKANQNLTAAQKELL